MSSPRDQSRRTVTKRQSMPIRPTLKRHIQSQTEPDSRIKPRPRHSRTFRQPTRLAQVRCRNKILSNLSCFTTSRAKNLPVLFVYSRRDLRLGNFCTAVPLTLESSRSTRLTYIPDSAWEVSQLAQYILTS